MKKKKAIAKFEESNTLLLEKWIDTMDENLPPLSNFILPGGGLSSSHLHVCRSITRRAERDTLLLKENNQVDQSVTIYLNRLSDYFFC